MSVLAGMTSSQQGATKSSGLDRRPKMTRRTVTAKGIIRERLIDARMACQDELGMGQAEWTRMVLETLDSMSDVFILSKIRQGHGSVVHFEATESRQDIVEALRDAVDGGSK
jgi:hypothetical protein